MRERARSNRSAAPGVLESRNVAFIGYHDLEGRPGFKMALVQHGERWVLYVGHLWEPGWSALDVTSPERPELVWTKPGPRGTWTIQVQAADGLLLTALEKPMPGWLPPGHNERDEGIVLWDIKDDPFSPMELGRFRTGGTGTHRNFYNGGRYAYVAGSPPGWDGNILIILDVSDPSLPREISRWGLPEQRLAPETEPQSRSFYLHGPPYVRNGKCFASYGKAGAFVIDVEDLSEPKLLSTVSFGSLGSPLGCHTYAPLGSSNVLLANSEALTEPPLEEPLNYLFLLDGTDPEDPRIMAACPLPSPEDGLGYHSYYDKGGSFGPHNVHIDHGLPELYGGSDVVFATYFNAGLRVFDVRDPREPVEVAYFVPTDPVVRKGPFPAGALVSQLEDVLVDSRGYVYCTDKNHGLFVLRFERDHELQ
jgi:hypothetical protein